MAEHELLIEAPDRHVSTAADAMAHLAKYLETHDEMHFMDAYRLLKGAVEGE